MNDRLCFAHILTANWAEAHSVKHSCFSENSTKALILQAQLAFQCDVVLALYAPKIQNNRYTSRKLILSSLPFSIDLAS